MAELFSDIYDPVLFDSEDVGIEIGDPINWASAILPAQVEVLSLSLPSAVSQEQISTSPVTVSVSNSVPKNNAARQVSGFSSTTGLFSDLYDPVLFGSEDVGIIESVTDSQPRSIAHEQVSVGPIFEPTSVPYDSAIVMTSESPSVQSETAPIVFPAGLPTIFLQEGFKYLEPDLTMRSSMDSPMDKVRKRFTSTMTVVVGKLNLTLDQRNMLKEFWKENGADRFWFPHPFTGVSTAAIFLDKPQYTPVQDGHYCDATLSLGFLP